MFKNILNYIRQVHRNVQQIYKTRMLMFVNKNKLYKLFDDLISKKTFNLRTSSEGDHNNLDNTYDQKVLYILIKNKTPIYIFSQWNQLEQNKA